MSDQPLPLAAARQAKRVERYYRWLDRLPWFHERRGEAGHGALPVHRALADPAGGPASPSVIHRLMLDGVDLPQSPRALDAGCGYGATMIELAPKLGGVWTGLTLSAVQAARGQAELARLRLANRVWIEVRSYDQPLEARYDLVYGIESLIHSADPAHTLRNLAASLAIGGHLVIVDDMPLPALPAEAQARFDRFRRFWRAPVAPTREGWIAAAQQAGLQLAAERDLSPLLRIGGREALDPMIAALERRAWLPRRLGFGLRLEAEIGGRLLETLQSDGFVEYRVLAFRRSRG